VLGTRSPLVRRRVGHHIVGVFKETASGAKNDQVERKKVLALAQAREIDTP
jgi:putative DNA-invertase from lambdoid prophage Rac